MFIDPHVHARDMEESHKETIEHILHVAERAGFSAIFAMPNTKPALVDEDTVKRYLSIAQEVKSPVWFGVYMALTGNKEQVKRAVDVQRRCQNVVGFKLYAGHSTNNTGVVDLESQYGVYQTLASEGYAGVLAVHCEKQELLSDFDPADPVTHAERRPAKAEVTSVQEQLMLASGERFKGTLHIAHVSVPASVRYSEMFPEVRVTYGVTLQHCTLDLNAMCIPGTGLYRKMNPPLRPAGMNKELVEMLRDGRIDWVETDHAPHRKAEKLAQPYASGMTGVQKYPKFVEWLRSQGFSEKRLEEITFSRVRDAFKLDIKQRSCVPERDLESEYEFDPYEGTGVLE